MTLYRAATGNISRLGGQLYRGTCVCECEGGGTLCCPGDLPDGAVSCTVEIIGALPPSNLFFGDQSPWWNGIHVVPVDGGKCVYTELVDDGLGNGTWARLQITFGDDVTPQTVITARSVWGEPAVPGDMALMGQLLQTECLEYGIEYDFEPPAETDAFVDLLTGPATIEILSINT